MLGCGCFDTRDMWKDFSCKIEASDKGLTISITGDDPKKVEALKKMVESYKDLCGGDCCK